MEMQNLCSLRNVFRIIRNFELKLQEKHQICLNEGMLLCSLKEGKYTSGEVADILGLSNSNTSKVIKSVEEKGFVRRIMGKEDKRQMYFSITEKGLTKLSEIKCETSSIDKVLEDILVEMRKE